ncbi:MAG TPA: hypothetical protein VGC11_14915 [Acidimicrobiia bacterium]|jgi:hypothetical protein
MTRSPHFDLALRRLLDAWRQRDDLKHSDAPIHDVAEAGQALDYARSRVVVARRDFPI